MSGYVPLSLLFFQQSPLPRLFSRLSAAAAGFLRAAATPVGHSYCRKQLFDSPSCILVDRWAEYEYNNKTNLQYGGVKVSTGIVRHGKRVAGRDRYKIRNF